MTQYSIIIPAYNEEENIADLLHEVRSVMSLVTGSWEVIVVDDASHDETWKAIRSLSSDIPIRGFRLQERSGQTGALQVGFQKALGDIFITLDGDGQNDPHDIPLLLENLNGFDCVSGYREKRYDTLLKRMISKTANKVRRFLLGDEIIDTGCSLKVFKRQCVDNIQFFKGMHRFLSSLFLISGYTVKQIPVSHRPRTRGTSKYTLFNRGFSVFFDLLAVRWMKKRRLDPVIQGIFINDSRRV
jgi:dolichol-phosphate mannosyltransferase